MPLILGTNSIKDTGFNVANSLRFNGSGYMTRTAGTPTNSKKHTFSAWVKLSVDDTNHDFPLSFYDNSGNDQTNYYFRSASDNTLYYSNTVGGNSVGYFATNRKFTDSNSWLHMVIAEDTTLATANDRVKLYINGVQETSFSANLNPSQNQDNSINKSGSTIYLGQRGGSYGYFHGYMAEMVFIDGQQLNADSFGEFDQDSNIWKPKDVSSLTFGNNGFYLDFENSGSLGADVSGNGNNFTVYNLTSVDQSTDTCTNNFATINPLYYSASSYTLTNGNLAVDGNSGNAWRSLYGTFGLTSGKWYWEIKIDGKESSDPNNFAIGIVSEDQVDQTSSNGKFFGTAQGYAYHGKDGKKLNNDTVTANGSSYGDSFTTGDIVGVFLDLDNHKLYFSKNGTVQASGDPTSGSTGTNAAFSITSGHTYLPAIANYYSAEHYSFNYGSPPFSISSGNSDPNGFGNFEYSTQNYYSCNTKNLAEFG